MKTYNYILKEWLKSKNNLKIQSYQRYESIINNYISNNIGTYNIKNITTNTISSFFNELNNNNLSISTKKNILYIIKASINYSYNNKYSKYIDLKEIKIKNNNKSIYILSKKDQLKIESYINNNKILVDIGIYSYQLMLFDSFYKVLLHSIFNKFLNINIISIFIIFAINLILGLISCKVIKKIKYINILFGLQ